jgi:DNA processing protein
MSGELVYLLALSTIPGVGAITARQLISYCGGPKEVFEAGFRQLASIPGVGPHLAKVVVGHRSLDQAESELKRCERAGVSVFSYRHSAYPRRLLALYDAPLLLYVDGDANLNQQRTVGIVGTRRMTDYGKRVTEQIVRDLQPFETMIVSGLAYGIDIAAHREAIRQKMATVGVMASGIDVIYPAAHQKTASLMKERGGVVTENCLGTKPDLQRFPARNRIIAGLSDVLIVVESAAKGGGLITVEFAMNYHRDVYAVPGALYQPMSEGCNQLIRQNKAALFSSVLEMVDELRWGKGHVVQTQIFATDREQSVFEGFTTEESQILALLKRLGPVQIDELNWQTGLAPGKVATLLLNLEFKGVVKSLPGKKYALA